MAASQNTLSSMVNLGIFVVGLLLLTGGGTIAAIRRRRRGTTIPNTSVLLSYYTQGTDLVLIGTGEVGDMPYSAITTVTLSLLLYRVQLDFSSQLHLLGIPKDPHVAQLDPAQAGSLMEPVSLEGDYNDYFSLYCEKGQQEQARYILDPAAMAFTIDFCRSHNWEIIDTELYFVQATADSPADPTDLFDDIAAFVKAIKPAVTAPLTEQQRRDNSPYGVETRTKLSCPVCGATMPNTDGLFVCPYGDGLLLNAAKLYQLRTGTIAAPAIAHPKQPIDREGLSCPSCQHVMKKVPYNGGLFVMDTCTNCHYRWLDAPEVPRLAGLGNS